MADPEFYRTKEEVQRWHARDPIPLFERQLRDWGLIDDAGVQKLEDEVERRRQRGGALRRGEPVAGRVDPLRQRLQGVAAMPETNIREALRQTLQRGAPAGRARHPHGRGHRRVRRLLRRHARLARGVRRRARARYADLGVGRRRLRHRRRDGRPAARRRADDDQLQLPRHRPDRQQRVEGPLHVRRPDQRAARHPHGQRRRQPARRDSTPTTWRAGTPTCPASRSSCPRRPTTPAAS